MHLRFALKTSLFGIHLGKIGPYFISTHFLYGSEESATEFLKFAQITSHFGTLLAKSALILLTLIFFMEVKKVQ